MAQFAVFWVFLMATGTASMDLMSALRPIAGHQTRGPGGGGGEPGRLAGQRDWPDVYTIGIWRPLDDGYLWIPIGIHSSYSN